MKSCFKSCFTKLLDIMKNLSQGFEETQGAGWGGQEKHNIVQARMYNHSILSHPVINICSHNNENNKYELHKICLNFIGRTEY